MSEERRRPYRSALALALGSALAAALVTGLGDVLLTLAEADGLAGGEGREFALRGLGLYGLLALVAGLLEGVILGAVWATHPRASLRGLWRRLGDDEELDRKSAGALLAGMGAAGVYALVVAAASMPFVAHAVRKGPGALLLGAVAAVAVPLVALVAWPLYRVTRRIARIVPRLGRIPATAVVLVLAAGLGAAAATFVIVSGLDWRGVLVQLGGLLALAAFFIVQLLLVAIAGARLERWGAVVAGVAAVALAGGALALMGQPGPRVAALLAVESRGPKVLAGIAKRLADRDGDGYAALLAGGDCAEGDPRVHPGAEDVPGNGIDENCLGGDAKEHGESPVSKDPVGEKQAGFKWDGNILLIGVDTLRGDRLGAAGYQRKGRSLTPRIDELARKGVYFRRAYAQAPHTPRSFPSIFTSRVPSEIAWNDPNANYPVLKPEAVTLFEALSASGWKTVGETSHFYFTEERGIRQGFAEFDNDGALDIKGSNHDIASPRIVAKTKKKLAELAQRKERFALFVHLFEPHSTYMEHDEFPVEAKGGPESLMEKYDWEVAFVDQRVGELIDALAENGLAERTMIVLFSDHGEAFGAHRVSGQRIFFHGQTLYEEVIRVPVIVVAAGLAPRTVDGPVMLIDVAPTLLDVVKGKTPPEFRGRSLLAPMVGEALAPRPAYAELLPYPNWPNAWKVMIDEAGRWKIVYRVTENLFELYDLAKDPNEQENVMGSEKAAAADMKQRITAWMESL